MDIIDDPVEKLGVGGSMKNLWICDAEDVKIRRRADDTSIELSNDSHTFTLTVSPDAYWTGYRPGDISPYSGCPQDFSPYTASNEKGDKIYVTAETPDP